MSKIIIVKGDALTPQRFWMKAVCERNQFTEKLESEGWVQTTNREFLTDDQIAYLEQPERGAEK
ncbi:hypothetical protein RKD55_004621 [Rossellomorea marisflavi]